MMSIESWTIPGAEGQMIIGDCHLPERTPGTLPRGVVLIAHGFKGYKDYGMFPRIAQRCAAAGFIAHRFNFSHSGMTNDIATFARPDLFEQDTWNKQVLDLRTVIEHVNAGAFHEPNLPYAIFGHSRGGVTALLTAGRFANDATFPQPAGVITAAAPSSCNPFTPDQQQQLLQQGYLDSPSSRTGQTLRVGRAFLQEMLDDPAGHDLLALVSHIRCPILVLHGESDPTVPVEAATRIVEAAGARARRQIIPGADHVFNTPNPLPAASESSQQLETLIQSTIALLQEVFNAQQGLS